MLTKVHLFSFKLTLSLFLSFFLSLLALFSLQDTAGQERYHSLAPMYYRGAAAAIIVYDITSTDSFNRYVSLLYTILSFSLLLLLLLLQKLTHSLVPISSFHSFVHLLLDLSRAKNWVRELQRQGNPELIVALAGNKADLAAQRAVEPAEAQGYADENGLFFVETSAKTSVNVGELFNEIAKRLPKPKQTPKEPGSGNVVLTRDAPKKTKQQCC